MFCTISYDSEGLSDIDMLCINGTRLLTYPQGEPGTAAGDLVICPAPSWPAQACQLLPPHQQQCRAASSPPCPQIAASAAHAVLPSLPERPLLLTCMQSHFC